MQDSPFWQYSLTVYSRPGVEPLLIMLQDRYQADVNILLCCAWLGSQGQRISPEGLQSLLDLALPWQQQCVQPLRSVRRYLKGREDDHAFREQIKAIEVEAERRQQVLIAQQLQSLSVSSADPEVALSDNLDLYGSLLSPASQGSLSPSLSQLAELIK
ncbi:TIGR02444 family protein [Oceanicoccus sagamiensis]|nr:TIGR02444 family protein [Oceanicoccus sagamiensis]